MGSNKNTKQGDEMKKWLMRSLGISMLLGAGLAQAALVTTTTYTGSGALGDAANWDNGLWSNTNPGLVDTTDGGSQNLGGDPWVYSFQIRQTGGTLTDVADQGLAMRGGAENTTDNGTFEIDDASNTNFAYANLDISGQLTLWNQYANTGSTGNIFSLLNGYATAAILAGTSPADIFINILDGRLDAGYFSNARFTVNMLAGGTGEVNLADMGGTAEAKSQLDQMILNFETGSEASFTLASNSSNVTGSAVGAWETKIAAGQVQIDGAAAGLGAFDIQNAGALGTTLSLAVPIPPASTMVTTTTFDGSGITEDAANWDNGLPSVSNPGLFNQTTSTSWLPNSYKSVWVKHTGGQVIVIGANNFAMRGGLAGTTEGSIIDIDDTFNNAGSYTNMAFNNTFTMWNSNAGVGNELNVLNGYATIDLLAAVNSPAEQRINILNGKLDIASLSSASCTVKMLAGGTGEVNLADQSGALLDPMVLNFEAGSKASFTIASSNVTGSAQGYWETKIAANKVKIDGVVTNAGQFQITDVGTLGTTIRLFDLANATPTEAYDSWIGGYGVGDTAMDADPDVDGYDNLFEYGVGGNPNDAGVNGNIPETSTVGDWFYYVHYERTGKDDVGLSYALEAGSDLVNTNWSAGNLDLVGSGVGPSGYTVYTNRVSTETLGTQFIKLDIGFTE